MKYFEFIAHIAALYHRLLSSIGVMITVWREAILNEKNQPSLIIKKKNELEFLPAALEISETPVSTTRRFLSYAICAFFVLALVWSCLFSLDVVVVAPAKLYPSIQVKTIQPLESSLVEAILVHEGQMVEQGDPLIELRIIGASENSGKLQREYDSAKGDRARLRALLSKDPEKEFKKLSADLAPDVKLKQQQWLENQLNEFVAKRTGLEFDLASKKAELRTTEADLYRLQKLTPSLKDRAERRMTLYKEGLGTIFDQQHSEEELSENDSQIQIRQSHIDEIRAAISSLTAKLDELYQVTRHDNTAKLSETETQLSAYSHDLQAAKSRQNLQIIRAPVAGVAQQLAIHTVGGVVTPAQNLLTIVPSGAVLEAVAKLANKDIGFIEIGQEAAVKFDSFPYTRYGTIDGEVTTISLDAIRDEEDINRPFIFPIRVKLLSDHIIVENNKSIPLMSGMTASIEINVGRRRLITYLLEPLQNSISQSMQEK